MTENNIRLIDEALQDEPIKNTFRLAWEFIILNKNFTFTAMGIFVVLNLLGVIPIISLVFGVFAAVFGIVIQMHVGRTFYATGNIETYLDDVKSSRLDEMLTKYVKTAFGVYVGWIALLFVIVFVLAIIAGSTGLITQGMSETEMLFAVLGLGFPVILIALVFSYVQPLVYSNIILANSFSEGFKAVFSFFTKDVWSSAMRKEYFTYVAKIGLVLILAVLAVAGLLSASYVLPMLSVLFSILLLAISYLFMVLMSVMAMMARRIVEEQ